jgi:hypothetical protein
MSFTSAAQTMSPSRGRSVSVIMSPKRADYLSKQYGFFGRLLVFVYSLLICCCAR